MRVFIADDSARIREQLSAILAELDGIEVPGSAADGITAVEQIRTLRPDVVIMDYQMPGYNGMEILKRVRQIAPPPLVIISTNHAEFRAACLEAGADYFFDKTHESSELIKLIKRLGREQR